MSRVSYLPTAALVVRRSALLDDVGSPRSFDERLRYGEDVDLLWRLIAAEWRVRYDPTVQVPHAEPRSWLALLRRRFNYGTSAAPLARRHPDTMAPLVLQPWPTLTVMALLARRPLIAATAFIAGVGLLKKRLATDELPSRLVTRASADALWQTGLGIGRWCNQFAVPALLLALLRPGGADRPARRGRRFAILALLITPLSTEWFRRRPALDPVRFGLGVFVDEAAYGMGVWTGCVRERRWSPLIPSIWAARVSRAIR